MVPSRRTRAVKWLASPTVRKWVASKLKNIATNIDALLGDPAFTKSLRTTVANLQDVSANIKVMTSSKDEVAQGLKDLPVILKKVEESMNNIKAISEKSDAMLGENKKNIDATMESVKEITNNLKELTADVKKHPWKLIRKP